MPKRRSLFIPSLVSGLAIAMPLVAAAEADSLRATMEKWVETRRILSEEKSEWTVEREVLRSTEKLLKAQKKALEEEIAALEQEAGESDGTRQALVLERGEYQRSDAALRSDLLALEAHVRSIAPLLPDPLKKKLEPLLVQIPAEPDPDEDRLGQRLMAVLGVLAQTERFNATATFVGETRRVGGDDKVLVRTLYWGLGQAIYVDARGEVAGIGRPGPDGWEFSDEAGLADDAGYLLDIYEGNVDAIEFVALPVEVRP